MDYFPLAQGTLHRHQEYEALKNTLLGMTGRRKVTVYANHRRKDAAKVVARGL